MKHIYIGLILLLIASACNENTASQSKIINDSINQSQTTSLSDEDSIGIANSQAEAREAIPGSYHDTLVIDSIFKIKGNNYTAHLVHFCLNDSAVQVPARYNFDTQLPFTTHSFMSVLELRKCRHLLFRTEIRKEDFKTLFDPSLDSFAVLSYPSILIDKDTIEGWYSISIPATDVGITAKMKIDKDGNKIVQKD